MRAKGDAMTDAPDMEPAALKAAERALKVTCHPTDGAPTGEIAGLRRMSDAHREHAQSAVEHNATLNRLLSIAEARADRLEAEAADLRRKLEEHQDAEDKAAREMATVIQGLRNRATAAERKLEEAITAERERCKQIAEHYAMNPGYSEAENLMAGRIADSIAIP